FKLQASSLKDQETSWLLDPGRRLLPGCHALVRTPFLSSTCPLDDQPHITRISIAYCRTRVKP
ncbi:hypothetical protein RRG08_053276, partial [Elysia crispata]